MLANHLNEDEGYVYCERMRGVIPFSARFYDNNCASDCPYFAGSMMGRGVECQYEDPDATEPEVWVEDPFEFAKKRFEAMEREEVKKSIAHVIDLGKVE